MPYDIVDAFTDISELRNDMNAIIRTLIEKGIIPKPKVERKVRK